MSADVRLMYGGCGTRYVSGAQTESDGQILDGQLTVKRAGISTDFKEWAELAQDRAGWQKLIYQTAKCPRRYGAEARGT